MKIAPTNVEARDALGIEDYRKKSCMPIQYYEKDFETFSMVWEQGYIATPKAKRDKDKHLLEKAACLLFRLKIKKNYFPSVPGASIYSGHPTLLTAVHITMN